MRRPAIDGDQFGARAEPLDRRRYRSGATYEKRKDVGNRSCGRSHTEFLVGLLDLGLP